LFYDMKLIGDAVLDLALLPIGDNFTMGPDDALRAVELLRPRIVVPIHYDTFDVIEQNPNTWAAEVEKRFDTQVKVLAPGESLTL
ncbi:MAG: MBL fold metallo-hydrolase, partial [bacterium]